MWPPRPAEKDAELVDELTHIVHAVSDDGPKPGTSDPKATGVAAWPQPGAAAPQAPGKVKRRKRGARAPETPVEVTRPLPGAGAPETPVKVARPLPGAGAPETPVEVTRPRPGAGDPDAPGEVTLGHLVHLVARRWLVVVLVAMAAFALVFGVGSGFPSR